MSVLLVVGYVWPEPNSSAAGSRMLSLLAMFREQNWTVIFASPAEKSPHRFDLSQWQIAEQQIQLNDSSFDEQLKQWQPDMVMFDRFMLEEQFGWRVEQQCPDALRLLDTEDLHFLRLARQQAFKAGRAVTLDDLHSEQAQREIAAIYRSDLTLIISDAEMQLLTEHFKVPTELLCYSPFWLETQTEAELLADLPLFEQRQHFVSIGNFRHEPNWQAVLWLKQQIWPLIRKQLPKAELHIYGAYPPPKATQLHQPKEGFLVKGWAESAAEVVKNGRVLLAPLAFGAGLKGKFIDAMLQGTPNVTTAIGAEGMVHQGQWAGLIGETAEQIAEAAVLLYQDQALWQQKQQQGFCILAQRFAQEQHQPRVWQQLMDVQQQLSQHRLTNFTGAMLRHHQHRSTQFMAQWIEAKTKLAELKYNLAQETIHE
ncbi:MAG: glycosyltransferase family 4 protein [Gammaproteobacteria bacterium]|nr:glycosyltransferase family 4 protein [Gammaproteobacteria bacterium]MBU2058617.1 glycosyltransferase family 4 protein [Gammaproteobacteria bacterium]MBU2173569.1 glycosyltransferase family 4 protein [Gammaproteobacteria bacterium]MBU2246523.1 glycosyltransferase family 4 protein [Gammaproteobacteria bacterium]MBU2343196.1 glycosyltransferase family 4 protein [Gammaproteobacteria bacterium]